MAIHDAGLEGSKTGRSVKTKSFSASFIEEAMTLDEPKKSDVHNASEVIRKKNRAIELMIARATKNYDYLDGGQGGRF